ncbi:hypothetical protein B0H19DRAFT_1073593 [Mycena capillaripes]|nr:hypothetical protein B0H19DRAFT_1073593 [Mycena capillaripes]
MESPMIEGLMRSMETVDARCAQNGRRFRRHVDGILPTGPPADDEFDLYVLTVDQWNRMPPSDRVALWGTGCDLFIEGLLVTSKYLDPVEKLSIYHRLDEPIEVQVPGLKIPPVGEKDNGDYTNKKDGTVLNALQLPETYTPLPNPLSGRQTNRRIPTFTYETVPGDQENWQIVGGPRTLTISHHDKGPTRVTVEGPGERLERSLIVKTSKIHANLRDIPDEPAFESGYEGIILSPNAGTLPVINQTESMHLYNLSFFSLMQAKERIVIGLPPNAEPSQEDEDGDKFTLVTGGHFLAASTIIPSVCTLLHLVMMEHILTDVEHDGSWCLFVRVCVFWMDVTASRLQDSYHLRAYLPQCSEVNTCGWMDIICLASVLSTLFDRRHYSGGIPASEDAHIRKKTSGYDDYGLLWIATIAPHSRL